MQRSNSFLLSLQYLWAMPKAHHYVVYGSALKHSGE